MYFVFFTAYSMTVYNEYNVTSIGCFHCTSIGGDNPACEDPFNSTDAYHKGLYKDNCLSGMKGRNGLYPATACIKFDGYYSKLKQTFMADKLSLFRKSLTYIEKPSLDIYFGNYYC